MFTFQPIQLGVIDISGAYMQSATFQWVQWPINREIHVTPPGEWEQTIRGIIWLLKNLPYGIPEVAR